MPNHITTVCTVTGPAEDVAAFIAAHIQPGRSEDESKHFDFDTIVPTPQCIKDTECPMHGDPLPPGMPGPCGDLQVEMYAQCLLSYRMAAHTYVGYQWLPEGVKTWAQLRAWLDSTSPTAAFWGKRMLIAAAETGYPGWYEWNVANWGTKWGAYQYKERYAAPERFVFQFQTAWAVPIPIFEKLASMYPTLVFGLISIDEGGPEYEGTFQRGLCQFERKPDDNERYKIVYGEYPTNPEEDEDEPEERAADK